MAFARCVAVSPICAFLCFLHQATQSDVYFLLYTFFNDLSNLLLEFSSRVYSKNSILTRSVNSNFCSVITVRAMIEQRIIVYHFCPTCWFVKEDKEAELLTNYCCDCGLGPYNLDLYTGCTNCGHSFRLPTPIVSYDYAVAGYDSKALRIAPARKDTEEETAITRRKMTHPKTRQETEVYTTAEAPFQSPLVPGCGASILNYETDGSGDGYSESILDGNCSTCPTTPESVDVQWTIPPMVSIECLVDDVMTSGYFVSAFKDIIAGIVNYTANGGNSSTNTEDTALRPSTTKSPTGTKRAQMDGTPPSDDDDDNDDDDNDGDDEEDRKKRRKFDSTAKKSVRKLACPYFRRDPEAFKDDKSCSGPGWPDISRLKSVTASYRFSFLSVTNPR